MDGIRTALARIHRSAEENPRTSLPVMLALAGGFIVFPMGAFVATMALLIGLCARDARR